MPHILFVTLYCPLEKAAPAVRISETTARLVAHGYEVTVLTTVPNYPTGIVPPEYRGRILSYYKKCPFIFIVSDLWPESAVQLGMLRNRMLIRLAESRSSERQARAYRVGAGDA